MKITVIGTGYVGLTSGILFSYLGHNVTCLDINENKINKLKKNELPLYEPGLKKYMINSVNNKLLNFTTNYNEALKAPSAIFVAVDTPQSPTGSADLKDIYKVIDQLIIFQSKTLVIIKSTVPPGTTDEVQKYVNSRAANIEVANNPEYLREGSSVEDFLQPDRIIFGVNSDCAKMTLKDIYKPLIERFTKRNLDSNLTRSIPKIFVTNPTTSEMIKYVSNAFLATKLAFINEVANICEKVGADIEDLAYGIGLDSRIGQKFLKTGPGFGGSCFPKDISALLNLVNQHGEEFLLLQATIQANKKRPVEMIEKIKTMLGSDLKNKIIAVWGLTFKANTDDIRNSPAIKIVELLIDHGAIVKAYCPKGISNTSPVQNFDISVSAEDATNQAEAIIIATEWEEFKEQDFDKIHSIMKTPIIFDFRNIFNIQDCKLAKFKYFSLGRHNFNSSE